MPTLDGISDFVPVPHYAVMTGTAIALCAAISIDEQDGAPEWLHLLPAGVVATQDGRGPYRVADAQALCAASLAGGKIVLDENHATDLAAPRGGAAPAHGWITELQARADGIWGKVDWVDPAQRVWRRYRGVSPVIAHRKDKVVTAIRRASLTNTPNLTGLIALHQEENRMDFRAMLIEALGLDGAATDEQIAAAVKKMVEDGKGDDVPAALQSALAPIAALVGVKADAGADAILAGVRTLKDASADNPVVVALQSELTGVTARFNALEETTKRDRATAFVDGAIADGRVGVKPARDEYIAMHMEDPARVTKLVAAMPILKIGATLGGTPPADAKDGIGDADAGVIALMGIDREAFAKTRADETEARL